MNKTVQSLLSNIKKLKQRYDNKLITGVQVINYLHGLRNKCLSIHMNIDNYLYRNGILNKKTAIVSAKENINKYKKFSNYKQKFENELRNITTNKQVWFENYGIHDSPFHDLIKSKLDSYKIDGLLSSLICDLYVGTVNEGSTKDLMSF